MKKTYNAPVAHIYDETSADAFLLSTSTSLADPNAEVEVKEDVTNSSESYNVWDNEW